jgi:SAM-dependent methyltransferase
MSDDRQTHEQMILDQFTRQAIPFAQMPAHSNDAACKLIVETTGCGPTDTVLDVACGPGLVACALAGVARHVTGIDITPAMIEQARALQHAQKRRHMTWQVGDVLPLPYPDGSFSLVFTRYSFHHFLDPRAVLAEMVRVCKPTGRVCVVDVFTSPLPEKAAAYNRMEKLRDPSHVGALTLDELQCLLHDAGLIEEKMAFYRLEMEVERLLGASFPGPGDADKIRQIFTDDLDKNLLELGVHRQGSEIHFAYPTVILVVRKPA